MFDELPDDVFVDEDNADDEDIPEMPVKPAVVKPIEAKHPVVAVTPPNKGKVEYPVPPKRLASAAPTPQAKPTDNALLDVKIGTTVKHKTFGEALL